jgi:hypothetical protein
MKPLGKPHAENPHVRFDERGWQSAHARSHLGLAVARLSLQHFETVIGVGYAHRFSATNHQSRRAGAGRNTRREVPIRE